MNSTEISNIIYLHLSEILPVIKGGKKFEYFCRDFLSGHLKIEFMLPSGGGVGDGGHDFFAYKNTTLGRKKIAAACTIQNNDVKGKLDRDLKNAIARNIGDPIDEFYFFYHKAIKESIRTEVIEDILATYNITAYIYDGKHMADILSLNPKLRSIACEHLGIKESLIDAKNPVINRNINAKARYITLGALFGIVCFSTLIALSFQMFQVNQASLDGPSLMAVSLNLFLAGLLIVMYRFDTKKLHNSKINKFDLLVLIIALILFLWGSLYVSSSSNLLPYPYGIYFFLLIFGGMSAFFIVTFFSVRVELKRVAKKFEA